MERESFEDQEVAGLLNRDFVAIKVDREERPDIDHIYMTVCQAMTGHGGWPLTIIMTPDKKPFFAATYIPKKSRYGMTGLMELLPKIAGLWANERSQVLQSGDKVANWLKAGTDKRAQGELSREVFTQAYQTYRQLFDQANGGFGSAPKFPTPHNLYFLLRYYYMTGKVQALEMVEKTLQSMYRGGIYDHIGFGFARYSTDQLWLVPHFEKMLYDNALLVIAYAEAYQVTGNPLYARVVRETLAYILRDMTAAEGGFYSAEDADSEGEEGKFYVWTVEEIMAVLGEERGRRFCQVYGISREGNFEGINIPNLIYYDLNEQERQELEAERQKLFTVRKKRVPPYKDDKILTAWNGLMIAALAIAFRVLGERDYLQAAQGALAFIMQKLRREDGRLLARYRDGEALYPAYSADYSFLIWGLIELYEASYDVGYLELARELAQDQLLYFWDESQGGLFFYGRDAEQLLARPKEAYDGAIPSDNSVAALNFARLARLTGDGTWEEKAQRQFKVFAAGIAEAAVGHAFFLTAFWFARSAPREVVIVGDLEDNRTREMLTVLNTRFLPDTVIVLNNKSSELMATAPYLKDMKMLDGQPTAYLCENFACQIPANSAEQLLAML